MQDELSSQKVLSLKKPDIKDRDIAAFLAYWEGLRHGTDVPRRSEVDPRGIEALLANAFIAEKIAPGLARMRIAGTHLSDLMGMEVRGMPVSAFIAPEFRDELAGLLVDVFERPATLLIEIASGGGFGKPALTGTLILLPLRSDLGDISRALGCLVTRGPLGRAPRRFNIVSHQLRPIEASATTSTPMIAKTPRRAGMAEPARPFIDSTPLRDCERPYLRLIQP